MATQEEIDRELVFMLELQRGSADILSQICASIDKAAENEAVFSVEEISDAYRAVERAAGGMERLVELATHNEEADPDIVAEALSLNERFSAAAEKIATTLSALREAEAGKFSS
jgi:hypothetical protein